jgi:two-component system, NtrC family, C4-dicarboxylate transport response regulator DctD
MAAAASAAYIASMNSGIAMPSIDHQEPHARGHHLHAEIDLAAGRTAPVLITAPPGCAATIVQAIAARSHRDLIPVAAPHAGAADDVLTAIAENRLGIRTARAAILWLKEVHRLNAAQQAATMKLVEAGAGQVCPAARIVASTSVDLFELVERGSFDARLFYRLNTIHLVVDMTGG